MQRLLPYFYGSFVTLGVALLFGLWLGGVAGAWTVIVLAVLETSLSLDNAVVNATVLENWSHAWRRLFIYVGLPIAVFGMRLVFPVVIVSLTTGLGMLEALQLAMHRPTDYANALISAHQQIAAFGGTFLLMVALQFFIDDEKENHWIVPLEKFFVKLSQYEVAVEAGITMAVLLATTMLLGDGEKYAFIVAGLLGFITYIGARVVGQMLSGGDGSTGKKVAQGIGGLLYLEILDASFSFDGVIGAFAVSNNLFLIAAGLGVGAMFVRSLTIYLVDKGTLGEYRYLEHGAFWAILALAAIMFIGVKVEVPDTVTGFIGAAFILSALWSSVRVNRRERLAAEK